MLLTELQDYKKFLALGVGSRTTIWRMIRRGEIAAIKTDSGRVLIPRDSLVAYLHNHAVKPEIKL